LEKYNFVSYFETLNSIFMRDIEYLVIDCTMGVQSIQAGQVNDWYIRPKKKGGKGQHIGSFHWLVEMSGNAVKLYDDEIELPNPKAFNIPFGFERITIARHNSVIIGWIGGNDARGNILDNRTTAQNTSLLQLVSQYILAYPTIKVVGKNQIQEGLESPCFFVPDFFQNAGIPSVNIYQYDNFSYLTRVRQTNLGLYDEDWFLRNRAKRFLNDFNFVAFEWKTIFHGLGLKNKEDFMISFFHEGKPAMTWYEPVDENSIRVQTAFDCTVQVNVLGLS
jgi:hypothetical protein